MMAAIGSLPETEQRLVHTGQRYDDQMARVFFRDLGLPRPDRDLKVGSRRMARDRAAFWWAPLVLAAGIAALGLLPHAVFSAEAGKLEYFKSAYDEDTYALWLLTGAGPRVPGRLLSVALMRILFALCGRCWDVTYVAADVVFPVLAAAGAWFLAGRVSRAPAFRLLFGFLHLFAQDLFSFEGSAILNHGTWGLRSTLAAVVPRAPAIIPDAYSSYFSLFRTPEPQVSLGFFLALFALLVCFLELERGRKRRRVAILLLLASAGLGALYLFLATGFALCVLCCALLLAIGGDRDRASWLGLCGVAGSASITLGAFALPAGPGMLTSVSYLFRSRLPVVSAATVASAVLLGSLAVLSGRGLLREPRRALAVSCFATVLALTNQQIVTGWMMETREWERYPNYPLVLIGILLWVSASHVRLPVGGPALRNFAWALLLIAASLVSIGQFRVFGFFRHQNEATLAMKTALDKITVPDPKRARIVLDEPDLAPLLEFRMHRRLDCVIDFTDTVRRIPSMDFADGNWGLRSRFKESLFEQFARTGWSPERVSRALSGEAELRAGFFLAFLFSPMDHWFPLSDDRRVRQREIQAMIPAIARGYEEYLASSPASWREPAIRLSERPVANPEWRERLLGSASGGRGTGAVTVYAFLQSGSAAAERSGMTAKSAGP